MSHLTSDQIERYASRSGDVDEILAIAQHFEICADCRDLAAALVDPGEDSHARRARERRVSGPRAALTEQTSRILWWSAALVLIIIIGVIAMTMMMR
jgi:hypothetical protein